jgi:serine protease AprX
MAPNSTLATNYHGTLVPNSYYQTGGKGNSTSYMRLSGTSMATPVVTGAAVLLLQQSPWLTPDQVKARLMKTAAKTLSLHTTAYDGITKARFNLQSDIFEVGAGYLDIQAAIYNHDLTTMPALSAIAVLNTSSQNHWSGGGGDDNDNTITITRSFMTSWGSSVVWGDQLVYGSDVFSGGNSNGLSVVWGDSAIWGMDDGGGGFSVVWGDTALIAATMQALDVGGNDFSVVWGD